MQQVALFEMGPSIADASGGMRSKARTVLIKILNGEELNRRIMAKKVRCSAEFVGLCANGKRKPERWRLRVAFQRHYGILAEWWDVLDEQDEPNVCLQQ